MPSTNKKVAWEKWDEDVLDQEIIEDTVSEFGEYEEDSSLAEDALMFLEKIPKLVTTPLGMFQLYDKMSVMNQYECWMGYTNFDITEEVKDVIESAKGVELLVVLTRYRFFLGVAKLFNFRDVRVTIENELCNRHIEEVKIQDEKTRDEIEALHRGHLQSAQNETERNGTKRTAGREKRDWVSGSDSKKRSS